MLNSRRLRAFKRWMKSEDIQFSNALQFTDSTDEGISVRALCDLKEGDVVARIPKAACLTIKTSGASSIIEEANLDGYLGLSAALMYEKSLGKDSPWAGYLQALPNEESLPLLWTLDEVDQLLCGTELHKTVKEDISFMYEDWKESILPIMDSSAMKLDPKYFGVEEYFRAKSLIASRSFEIDEYHGFGMVPLADLFNHKTGAEDVHFTSVSSHTEFDDSSTDTDDDDEIHHNAADDKPAGLNFSPEKKESENILAGKRSDVGLNCSTMEDDPSVLQMIMIKDVKIGSEIFNTYGLLGNAALLHRYGFTEPNNPNDIVNIDLELVLQWSFALFSSRHSRARLSLWRRLDCAACLSQDSEYFEISYDGEPQIELLILLYTILLPESAYRSLDIAASNSGDFRTNPSIILCKKRSINSMEVKRDLLLTKDVRKALISLADARDRWYGLSSLKDDIEAQGKCSKLDKKKYHSLTLRISERTILDKLRTYASSSCRSSTNLGRMSKRKKTKFELG